MFSDKLTSQKRMIPLSDTSELSGWENRPFQVTWSEVKQANGDTLVAKIQRKKKRNRTLYTTHQLETLEGIYKQDKYVHGVRRGEIAKELKVSEKCIKVWFQNRRMKQKKQSSESSSDSASESSLFVEPGTPISITEVLPVETIGMGVQEVQHEYPQTHIFPPHIENAFNASAQNEFNGTPSNYNYLSGYHFPNDGSIYPAQQNYPCPTAFYTFMEQYQHFANGYVNGYDWQTSCEFNFNQFQ